MEATGRLTNVSKDWQSGKWQLTFEINEAAVVNEIDNIKDVDKLAIKATKYREKRSLDANAYAWVLMQKIAEAVHSDRWAVYLELLQKYSRSFTHIIVKEAAVDRMKELYRTCVDLGEVKVNGQTGHQLQVYYGSSTFNMKEMSVFIDGIVSECKELGIETMTPDELGRMKAAWQNQ